MLEGGVTMSEREPPTPIECPKCFDLLAESSDSILASLRCASCGHMLAFDEVLALRDAERARARKYD
jgi:phage FluMu protein Com